MPELKMGIDLTWAINKQKFAKAIFGITKVMEGTRFYALFAMILSLHRHSKMTGIGQMFQYTFRDELNHIAFGFRAELVKFTREASSWRTAERC